MKTPSKDFLVVVAFLFLAFIAFLIINTNDNPDARCKKQKNCTNTHVQSDLATAQTQAEIYYSNHANSYGTAGNSCSAAVFSDPTITKAIAGAQVANGGTAPTCNNSTTAYAISSIMRTDNPHYWCVDSIGDASQSTTVLGTNTVCPVAN